MELLRCAIREFRKDRCGTVAAALAYFTVFSLPALLAIAIYISGLLFGTETAAREIERQLGSALSPQISKQVNVLLEIISENLRQGGLETFIGLASMFYAATRAFVELHRVLNRTWKVEDTRSGFWRFAMRRISAFVLILALSVLLLVSMAIGTVIWGVDRAVPLPLFHIWHFVAPGVLFILLVAAAFKVLPDAHVHWKDVWFGAIITGTLLASSKYLLSIYFSRTVIGGVFGVAGSFALVLLWLYFSYAVLLFGAELTQVRAERKGRPAEPADCAVKTDYPDSSAA